MNKVLRLAVEVRLDDDGTYFARVPEWPGCIIGGFDTVGEALEQIGVAMRLFADSMEYRGIELSWEGEHRGQSFSVILVEGENGWVAFSPTVGGVYEEGSTREGARENAILAARAIIDAREEEE